MVNVYALMDGMENTVQLKDARPVAQITVHVALAAMVYGSAAVMMDGMEQIVQLLWNKIVQITRITIKVCIKKPHIRFITFINSYLSSFPF